VFLGMRVPGAMGKIDGILSLWKQDKFIFSEAISGHL